MSETTQRTAGLDLPVRVETIHGVRRSFEPAHMDDAPSNVRREEA